jgi:hypothetical protein
VDRLIDPSAPDEERQRRERRFLKGPKEFRDIRDNRVNQNADKRTAATELTQPAR